MKQLGQLFINFGLGGRVRHCLVCEVSGAPGVCLECLRRCVSVSASGFPDVCEVRVSAWLSGAPSVREAELEFVQIVVIVVVMMVVVVVIPSPYRLSARSFLSRHGQGRRREDALSSEGCLWPSESAVSGNGIQEPQVYAPPRPTDRLVVPPFSQRDRFHRFQPTYPYLQHEIDLPPTISLSDGEEPPPYQGPCTLQLRDPEQQLELNRESVRAPPNRTIFDSDLLDSAVLGGPCPPSSNSGISATCYGSGGRMEGPPPTYSEVIGHYPGSSFQHQLSSGPPSLLHHTHIGPLESSAIWGKEKDKQKGHPL
ncbi:protein TMEPAI [Tupaia chinensis]|uniref:protein TMEPAI n=1 Tax=Tupaia chinensis TaxID=246437 RepID=UPI000FFB9198|nr:protein TMEPAI [Tupaia chinensis]